MTEQNFNLPVLKKSAGVSIEKTNLAIDIPDDLAAFFDVSNNMVGVTPRLPQIGILHAGQLFKMPDDTKKEKFYAVILDQTPANAWWEKSMTEGGGSNKTPDCYSMDGLIPSEGCVKKQNDKCKGCKQNEFGSDRKGGKGKDCKNMKRLHLIMEGSSLPRRFSVPPSSIKPFEYYMTNVLTDLGLNHACVVTEFSLVKAYNADGTEFSEVRFSKVRILTRPELYIMRDFIVQYKEEARNQDIEADEYMAAEKVEDDYPTPEEVKNVQEVFGKNPDDDIPY